MIARRTGNRALAVLVALALALTSCGNANTSEGQSTTLGVSEASGADSAPTGPDLGLLGQGSLEGQDVVVWFWAEW